MMMKLKSLLSAILTFILCLCTVPAAAQRLEQAGKTDCGVLYVDTDAVSTVKKDGAYYLAVVAEERYTDQQFLASLREGEDMGEAVGAVYMYLFDNRGSSYCTAAAYIVDAAGKVCADLGSHMQLQPLGGNKTMLNAYTLALKAVEKKKRFSGGKFVR